jgi:hypothetical protein
MVFKRGLVRPSDDKISAEILYNIWYIAKATLLVSFRFYFDAVFYHYTNFKETKLMRV